MKPLFVYTVVFILLLTSCSKKDSVASKEDLLVSGSWKLIGAAEDNDANGTYETDAFAGFLDCFKDNYYTFSSKGELELNENTTKCDPGDPQTMSIDWEFTQNETHLMVGADEYAIEELTASSLKLKQDLAGGRSSLTTFTKR